MQNNGFLMTRLIYSILENAHVLLNELRKKDKMRGFAEHLIGVFFTKSLINLIVSDHECKILYII